jgi:hypothetical protein
VETSSSDGSGIDIVAQNGTNGLFHNNYQHLVKNGDIKLQVSENKYRARYDDVAATKTEILKRNLA